MLVQGSVSKTFYSKGLQRKSFVKTLANKMLICYIAMVGEGIKKEENRIEK